MDDANVLARLDRIGVLERNGSTTGELLAELRGLIRAAEHAACEQAAGSDAKEVVERLGTAPHGT